MPHIVINGCDMTKIVKRLYVHADIEFSEEYFTKPWSKAKLDKIENELLEIVQKYFEDAESEKYSNHDWNNANNKY